MDAMFAICMNTPHNRSTMACNNQLLRLSVGKSKVFKPPNPWTMGIMNVLAELHQEEGLKLNLKFEIEVLCKTLNLDINVSKPGFQHTTLGLSKGGVKLN